MRRSGRARARGVRIAAAAAQPPDQRRPVRARAARRRAAPTPRSPRSNSCKAARTRCSSPGSPSCAAASRSRRSIRGTRSRHSSARSCSASAPGSGTTSIWPSSASAGASKRSTRCRGDQRVRGGRRADRSAARLDPARRRSGGVPARARGGHTAAWWRCWSSVGKPAEALDVARRARARVIPSVAHPARLERLDGEALARWEAAIARYRASAPRSSASKPKRGSCRPTSWKSRKRRSRRGAPALSALDKRMRCCTAPRPEQARALARPAAKRCSRTFRSAPA